MKIFLFSNLLYIRKTNGYSQKLFADKISKTKLDFELNANGELIKDYQITKNTYINIEQCNFPDIRLLLKLQQLFNYSLQDLLYADLAKSIENKSKYPIIFLDNEELKVSENIIKKYNLIVSSFQNMFLGEIEERPTKSYIALKSKNPKHIASSFVKKGAIKIVLNLHIPTLTQADIGKYEWLSVQNLWSIQDAVCITITDKTLWSLNDISEVLRLLAKSYQTKNTNRISQDN